MKLDLQNSGVVTAVIVLAILVIAVVYSVIAIKHKPPQMAYTVAENYHFPYNFEKLEWQVELGMQLREISGLTSLNLDQVMAIQDERGVLYSVDLNTGNVVSERQFDKNRDYEDLCLVGDHIFVLERDGDLYQTHLATNDTTIKFETAFSYRNDTESLCYYSKQNQLLIAPKEGAPDGASLPKNVVGVYGFDMVSKTLDLNPVVTVAEKEVGRIVGTKGGKAYKFKPSAVAIHPRSGLMYILASVGKILLVVDPNSNQLMHIQLLNELDFPQPEGMTFDANNNLLISSEGTNGRPGTITRLPEINTSL